MAKANKGYEDLQVWQKAISLAESIYATTKTFPKDEIYGLTSQMRRAAVSIASNIAEGCARNSTKEFLQFLSIASGSAAELKTQLIIAERIKLIAKDGFDRLLDETVAVERMLNALSKSLTAQPATYNLQLAT